MAQSIDSTAEDGARLMSVAFLYSPRLRTPRRYSTKRSVLVNSRGIKSRGGDREPEEPRAARSVAGLPSRCSGQAGQPRAAVTGNFSSAKAAPRRGGPRSCISIDRTDHRAPLPGPTGPRGPTSAERGNGIPERRVAAWIQASTAVSRQPPASGIASRATNGLGRS